MTEDKRNDRGADLHRTYLATGDLTLLDQAVELFRSAVAEAPADDPRRAAYLSNLAVGLSDRYERTGTERDLDETIETGWKAVRSTPSESPDRITYLGNLGVFLSDRYDRSGDLYDLDTAFDLLTESLEYMEPGSSDTARAYSNLSTLLINWYERSRRSDALDTAIQAAEAAEAALENTPKGDEEFPGHLINLGNARRMRYEHLAAQDLAADGEPAIEITALLLAIAAYERAAELSTGSWLRPKVLTNLGNVLLDKSAVLNSEDDYARAITCLREAVEVTPPSSTDLVSWLNNLATTLRFGAGESAEAVRFLSPLL
ncbi:hypothetical protein [Nonomuraea sp. NPDC048901]|uniref:hypothetical protein n=1 Tax=Nonomuraea sp. NPDC048901 TaxID=3155627 RepID=UPI00340BD1C4